LTYAPQSAAVQDEKRIFAPKRLKRLREEAINLLLKKYGKNPD